MYIEEIILLNTCSWMRLFHWVCKVKEKYYGSANKRFVEIVCI
jgi:hypothetical protein